MYSEVDLRIEGYSPEMLERIVKIHDEVFPSLLGVDSQFQAQIKEELSQLIECYKEGRDGIWIAKYNGQFAGSLCLDGKNTDSSGPRLRFMVVCPKYQGNGIGRHLLHSALSFCLRSGLESVHLWTFDQLFAAKHLYESAGFVPTEKREVLCWGTHLLERKYVLTLQKGMTAE